jgi:Rieske Fe-S protein
MKRREFVGAACTTLIGAFLMRPGEALATEGAVAQSFNNVVIVGEDGRALKAATLKPGDNFLFFYPLVSTPAFLINLGIEVKGSGTWAGAVGPNRSIVAFQAICTHALSRPTRKLAPITYRHFNNAGNANKDRVITCCVHGSMFDAADAGKTLRGPATAPLMAIALEYDAAADTISATGTYGPDWLHEKFIQSHKQELREEFGQSEYRNEVEGTAKILEIASFSTLISSC